MSNVRDHRQGLTAVVALNAVAGNAIDGKGRRTRVHVVTLVGQLVSLGFPSVHNGEGGSHASLRSGNDRFFPAGGCRNNRNGRHGILAWWIPAFRTGGFRNLSSGTLPGWV
jgi:hypothetical protein